MKGILAEQLPWVLGSDEQFAKFVELFDPISTELYDRAGDKEHLFDSQIAPLEMVRWLAGIIGVNIRPNLPESRQRDIAMSASQTFNRRGTAGSLARNLQTVVQGDVVILDTGSIEIEPLADPSTSDEAAENAPRAQIVVRSASAIDETLLLEVIERELPAHLPIELIVQFGPSTNADHNDAPASPGQGEQHDDPR